MNQQWQEIVLASDLSPDTQLKAIALFEFHGIEWLFELMNSKKPKSDGTSRESNSIAILSAKDLEKAGIDLSGLEALFKADSPESALRIFLFELPMFRDDDLDIEEELYSFLNQWVSSRISYLRTVNKLNSKTARLQAYFEVNEIPLGGEQLACNTCGLIFWDNLDRLEDAEKNYCSIECQEIVEFDCVYCGIHFVVGRATYGWKNFYRLNGFCGEKCYKENLSDIASDNSYVNGIIKRLEPYGSEVDRSVTRRAVHLKAEGICYLCKRKTNWKVTRAWDPLLATVDHIHPVSKGGSHTWENVALACLLCNTRKGTKEL